jgi:ABC-type multidrug transport system ATPase subunit
MIGFVPSLSASCSASLVPLIDLLETSQSCGVIMKGVVTHSGNFTTCTSGRNGVNCFDPNSVINSAWYAAFLVPVYRLPVTLTQCTLCTENSGMIAPCKLLLGAMINAVYGAAIDYSAFSITDPVAIDAVADAADDVKLACGNFADSASMQVLRYQSELLCSSQDTFNMTVSSAGNIDGILDMRSLMQCGTCAVLPCFSGQLCDGSGDAIMCPEGYYCPTTLEKIICPKGYFCPLGSLEPLPCDGNAAGSCEVEGSARAVTWIPLLISLLILSVLSTIPVVSKIIQDWQRNERTSPMKSKSRLFKSIPLLQDEISFNTNSSPVSIQFDNIKLVTGKTTRISDVSGHIRPGRFTAIIGGSGAGKTSLMNVILGREARTAGEVSYQSDDFAGKIPRHLLPRIVAFVPQNDVYLREMTVYELISHSARWRLPTSLTSDKIAERVEEVLDQLQLQHLRDVQVGGQQGSSTLSPGDKKKVNIALELVAGPNVLFLDEPTTGIDSSSALNVATIVRNLARTGLTCVAVIHQPRAEIFSLIDDMVILIRGGYVAYQGPTKYVMEYFAQYGLKPLQEKANKTDFLIDMVSKPPPSHVGKQSVTISDVSHHEQAVAHYPSSAEQQQVGNASAVAATEVTTNTSESAQSFSWADLWKRDGENFLNAMTEKYGNDGDDDFADEEPKGRENLSSDPIGLTTNLHPDTNFSGDVETNGKLLSSTLSPVSKAQQHLRQRREDAKASNKTFIPLDVSRPGFIMQVYLNWYRGTLQHLKDNVYWNDLFVHLLGGIIMGIATCGGPLLIGLIPPIYHGSCPPGAENRCNSWIRFEVGPATFLVTMILGSLAIPIAVRTFGREKEVFAREAAVGANTFAYFIGKVVSDFPFMALNSFVYMAPILAIAQWQAPADKFYAIMLCISLTVTSLGYGLSLIFRDPDDAVLTGVIFAILLNLFSGFVPTIGDGPIGQIMYTHWAARAITSAELMYGQGISEFEFNQIVPENWMIPDFGRDLALMVLISVLLLASSLILIWYQNRQTGKLG